VDLSSDRLLTMIMTECLLPLLSTLQCAYLTVPSAGANLSGPETSVSKHLTQRNNPEDGRIQFNSGGTLRSSMLQVAIASS
jgi:hypothetical protein